MTYRNMTAAQMRAARALIEWSQDQLASASAVSLSTVKRMESLGPEKSSVENIDKVSSALERAGAEFIDENGGGAGVRLTKRKSKAKR